MDRQRELVTLERLERRRGETWPGLWLAPLVTIVAQAFLLGVLADERVGWLARAAVLVAAVAACLAAIWSVLRAHAREVQYAEAVAEWTGDSDGYHPDLRPSALSRPHRRRRAVAPAAAPAVTAEPVDDPEPEADEAPPEEPEVPPEAETTVTENVAEEGETAVLDATPPPPLRKRAPTAASAPAPTPPSPTPNGTGDEEPEGWVARWDRHLVWWAAGDAHAKAYMAWTATLAIFALADVAVYLSCV